MVNDVFDLKGTCAALFGYRPSKELGQMELSYDSPEVTDGEDAEVWRRDLGMTDLLRITFEFTDRILVVENTATGD